MTLPGFDAPKEKPKDDRSTWQKRNDELKRRRSINLAKGMHPLGHQFLANNGKTCADCAHVYRFTMGKTYIKCDLLKTHSENTDLRVSWPACMKFEEASE